MLLGKSLNLEGNISLFGEAVLRYVPKIYKASYLCNAQSKVLFSIRFRLTCKLLSLTPRPHILVDV